MVQVIAPGAIAFSSVSFSFSVAPRCDNPYGCQNTDGGAKAQLNLAVLGIDAPPVR